MRVKGKEAYLGPGAFSLQLILPSPCRASAKVCHTESPWKLSKDLNRDLEARDDR
jgi:hypothetical protein